MTRRVDRDDKGRGRDDKKGDSINNLNLNDYD